MSRAIPGQARLTRIGIAAGLVVLAADQGSKAWVLDVLDLPRLGSVALLPVLNFTFVRNTGVTFGLATDSGPWGSILLTAIALAIVAALGVWLTRAERPLVAVALGAIAGGAIGNVVDRLRFGGVTDFIHAHAFGWSWYVFNVADAAIVCGVGALLVDGLLPHPPSQLRDDRLAPQRPEQ